MQSKRGWIFGGCALAVSALLVVGGIWYYNSRPSATSVKLGKPYTLEETILWRFPHPSSFNGTWVSDTELAFRDSSGSVTLVNVTDQFKKTLIPSSVLGEFKTNQYILSADLKYAFIVHNGHRIFRHSSEAFFQIFEIASETDRSLIPPGGSEANRYIQHVRWLPEGNGFVYVYLNNIYYRPKASEDREIQITTKGDPGIIFNGIADWVYEEEVLGSSNAIWFSSTGKRMAFAVFNDTLVDEMQFPYYGTHGEKDSQYPMQAKIRYPKAGRTNPTVEIVAVDLEKAQQSVNGHFEPVKIPPPVKLQNKPHYFTSVAWVDDSEVSVIWMNRHQNESWITIKNTQNSEPSEEALHETQTGGWLDLFSPPRFSKDGKSFLIILPKTHGSDGSYKHVTKVIRQPRGTPSKKVSLSQGKIVVTGIVFWDEVKKHVFFMATKLGSPGQRHLYIAKDVSQNTTEPQLIIDPFCQTCGLKTPLGDECKYISRPQFSKGGSYHVLTCAGPGVPTVVIMKTEGQKHHFTWADNNRTAIAMKKKANPIRMDVEIEIPGGYKAKVKLMIPPSNANSKGRKYPMLVMVYAGPNSQMVDERFGINFGTYVTTNLEYVYATIDGRGSGFQGDKLLFELYRRLGTVEVEDQITVAKKLGEKFDFIDKTKTAIFGWSYGGYVAGMAMAKDKVNAFKCGISGAPVTSWLYYDTIYTERYMGLPSPEDNQRGYNESDLMFRVENFRNKSYYLIHGTADDNVHYQHSMMLSKELELNEILFRQQSYPDENHGITHVRMHLYKSIQKFLQDCFASS